MTNRAGETPSRREQIVEVAATLFAQRGYGGVSIYDLGAALGTSGAALYKHFASKEALLAAILVDSSERLLSEGNSRAAAALRAGPEAILDALVAWHVEFALAHPALITLQFRELHSLAAPDQHTVRRLQRQYVELWVNAIQDAVGAEEGDARASAHAAFGLINSTPHSAPDGVDRRQLLCRMTMAAVHAVGSPPGS